MTPTAPATARQSVALDPTTGEWDDLPGSPDYRQGGWDLEAAEGPLVADFGFIYDDATATWTRMPTPTDAPHEGTRAAWGGGMLCAFGGADGTGGPAPTLSDGFWRYHPERTSSDPP